MPDIKTACVTTVTLTAIDNGVSLILLDRFGNRIAKTCKHLAVEASAITSDEIQTLLDWQNAYVRCSKQHHGRARRRNLSGWEKQAAVWRKSLRWRRNKLKGKATKEKPLRHTVRTHGTWQEACFGLRKAYVQKVCNERLRRTNHWRLWAETIYSNLRKRKDIHAERKQLSGVSDDQAISVHTKAAGRQMQLEWFPDHSSEVLT